MPVTLLPANPERTWPADLDRLAMLDMQGKWEPEAKPKPITPPVQPKPEHGAEAYIRREGMLQRQLARVARTSDERGRKIGALKSRLNCRDARIAALEEILRSERAELGKIRKREILAAKAVRDLQIEMDERDERITALQSRFVRANSETAAAQKALSAITLRAHDWLELREGKRVMREIRA